MAEKRDETADQSDILSDEQIEDGPPSMSDIAFSDRWEGSAVFAELQNRFGDYELDWSELKDLVDDRPALIARLAEATGLKPEAVRDEIERAEKSTL